MTKAILLKLFHIDDEIEKFMAIARIWNKEVEVFLYGDNSNEGLSNDGLSDDQLKKIITHLEWLNDNQKTVIDFALNAENFIDNFNDWIIDEVKKKGKAKLYDHTILTKPLSYDEIYRSIFIGSVFMFDDMLMSVDLISEPDYFGGHTFTVEIDGNFSMDFGGVNG